MKSFNKKLFFSFVFSLFLVTGILFFGNLAGAQTSSLDLGLQPVSATGLGNTDIRITIAKIIKVALSLLGTVALVLVLYAGYLWMTAGGDDEKIGTSKKILINATIGLAIILSAYSIVSFVMNKLVEATGNNTVSLSACELQKANGGSAYGGSCPANDACPYGNCEVGQFFIKSMPSSGDTCVSNVSPLIIFSSDVDVASLQNNILVTKVGASTPVVGAWSWQAADHRIAIFKPTQGVCPGGDVGKDCFDESSNYVLKIVSSGSGIKSDSGKSLNCALSTGKCADIAFTTGKGVDRTNPNISIFAPTLQNADLQQGNVVPVKINFSDDGGLQNIILSADGILVNNSNLSNCQKTGSVTIDWPTNKINIGLHDLKAIGFDWAANSAQGSSQANLKPAHCFDKVLNQDLGEKFVDCGGECGVCDGSKCSSNTDCNGGFCYKEPVTAIEGVCVAKTTIENISPLNSAIGDYITIQGKNFGAAKGHVYFSKVPSPNISTITDWVEAQIVNCGLGLNNWTENQIVVSVPDAAVSGKIAVFNSLASGVEQFNIKYYDTTGDGFNKVPNFVLSTTSHPGICGLNPSAGSVGANFSIIGKNFGSFDPAKSLVLFNDSVKAKAGAVNWLDTLVNSVVPVSLGNGDFGVRISVNNQLSNSVLYKVSGENQDGPFISNISTPAKTVVGDYITISGKNFGNNPGFVWFKLDGTGAAVNGNFNFPAACKNSVWQDNQIIVKVPTLEVGKKYTIQVSNITNGLVSPVDLNKSVIPGSGEPSPGICQISPVSGSVPFKSGASISVAGEYLSKINKFYFWKIGASSVDVVNTMIGSDVSIIDDFSVTTSPANKDIQSGLVFAYRSSDQKQSNGLLFSTGDCKVNGCASSGDKCCISGSQEGMCQPKGSLCAGEFKSSGFAWAFSTKDLLPPLQVVEQCGVQTDTGLKLPSPSPATIWNDVNNNDANKVCQTALVNVEFSGKLDQVSVSNMSVVVNACDSIDTNGACISPKNVALSNTPNSYLLQTANQSHDYLSLKPASGKWASSTLYQVILKDSITSISNNKGLSSKLLATKPCGKTNEGNAYCFTFKTGVGDCVLKQVVITPTDFWTKYLENPLQYHSADGAVYPLNYVGSGLSSQHCIMMDVSGFDWKWSVSDSKYAGIVGLGNKISTQIFTKANTVGIGIKNDSVDIIATASTSSVASKTGTSPLVIDLSKPEVVDFWPNCLEACTNASVGVKFNIPMSTHNLGMNSPAVKLVECNDENCLSTSLPIALNSAFDQASKNTILKIANENGLEVLKSNTLYQVSLSVSSTPGIDIGNQLWSVANSDNLSDPNNFSKPLNKTFVWRFRTKKEACKVDHVTVMPTVFTANKLKDITIFSAEAFASPDACNAAGQKLDPWKENWNWDSSNINVATVYKPLFQTKGSSNYCTKNCTLKGSTVLSGKTAQIYPVCGNNKIEAGEDCDAPGKNIGCSLTCQYLGNTDKATCGNGKTENELGESCDPKDPKSQVGCSDVCLRLGSSIQTAATDVNSSICGNGFIGIGEDCDLGIAADLNNPITSAHCSQKCLHLGTKLSSKWCFDHQGDFGGFNKSDYTNYCSQSYSQCGDGVTSPDEDKGCEFTDNVATGKHKDWCDDRCLIVSKDYVDSNCTVKKEGCDSNAQHVGSSLLYSIPSVCGDGVVGVGEDEACESPAYLTNFWHKDASGNLLNDPWVLVLGQNGLVGKVVTTTINSQESIITGSILNKNIKGSGKYQIMCGYKTDEECKAAFGNDSGVGVAGDSCCYYKPKLTAVYPGNTSTVKDKIAENICINTFIEAEFDSVIDEATLPGNFIIARSASAACTGGLEDVSTSTSFVAMYDSNLPWYKNVWNKIIITFKNIFGSEVTANNWCAGADVGAVQVVKNNKGGSKILFSLNNPLAKATDYVVILKKGIKNTQGVSIESNSDGKAIGWRFKTSNQVCSLSGVVIDPAQYYFSAPNNTTTLIAKGVTQNNQLIQPVTGYSWDYQWGPQNNPFILIQNSTSSINIITSQNNNGEIDVHASANLFDNKYSPEKGLVATGKSHIIVFLCENPWPPKGLILSGKPDPAIIFPYEDKVGNNDGFDLTNNVFNNSSIPASSVGKGYFNFSTYYCADNGENGIVDDLPYLRPAVQADASAYGISVVTSSLKRFIFTNDKNSDALGIQIFANPKHLSPRDWFLAGKEFGGQGFGTNVQDIKIDGYEAVTDGNNIYVGALNVDQSTPKNGNLYTNIYLFSINTNAAPETKKVFESLLKNLKFNINLTNYGYCGKDIDNPGDTTACVSDFDCPPAGACLPTKKTFGFCENSPATACDLNSNTNNCPPSVDVGQCVGNKCTNSLTTACQDDEDCTLPVATKCVETAINMNVCSNNTSQTCTLDSQCQTPQVCSVQKDKLKRNVQRIKDLGKIEKSLNDYANNNGANYPNLQSGTYLVGQSVSTWPSWSLLGNAVSASFPIDPINKLGVAGTCSSSTGKFCLSDAICKQSSPTETCVLHDKATGWSTADQRFSFACSSDSLAYRYFASSTGQVTTDYKIKLKLEDPGIVIDNQDPFIADFINELSNFEISKTDSNGICDYEKEITTINQGVCGDGKLNLNKGEQCDPPGAVKWNQSDCDKPGIVSSDIMTGQMCAKNCTWSTPVTTTCGILAKCGNGKVEAGEKCDDGSLNGKYNHCDTSCTKLASSCGDKTLDSKNEVCDFALNYTGWCVSGYNKNSVCSSDFDCQSTANSLYKSNIGSCITLSKNKQKYGLTSNTSCAFDCQKTGPFCGDGIVQAEFGEECDGNQTCDINNNAGERICSKECRWQNNLATLYYKFDENWLSNNVNVISDSYTYLPNIVSSTNAALFSLKAKCVNGNSNTTNVCPTTVDSFEYTKALKFNGTSQYLTVDHQSELDLNEMTFATWIKIDRYATPGSHAIASKQNGINASVNERDFNLYVVTEGKPAVVKNLSLYSLASDNRPIFGINNATDGNSVIFESGSWHFVAMTVDKRRQVVYYIDGQKLNSNFTSYSGYQSGDENRKADRDYPLWIGRADNYFQGEMDHVQLYNRALSSFEIQDLFGNAKNPCETKISATNSVAPIATTACGNGKVDSNEACDTGANVGVACTPTYNKSCTYCMAGCKLTKTVEAIEYCGDGVVNGSEKCDFAGDALYSLTTSSYNLDYFNKTYGYNVNTGKYLTFDQTHKAFLVPSCTDEYNLNLNVSSTENFNKNIFKNLITQIGTKSCVNSCTGISNQCVSCGLKKDGSKVSGQIINVLDPSSTNPLLASSTAVQGGLLATIGLMYSEKTKDAVEPKDMVAYKDHGYDNFTKYSLKINAFSQIDALIDSNPVCSDPNQARSYKLALNADWKNKHLIDFPVFGTTTPDKYNLLLSPVIVSSTNNNTNHHVRVVVSWVDVAGSFGAGNNDEFNAGFTVPSGSPITMDDTSFGSSLAVGTNYFNSTNKKQSVWYHGFFNANTTNVESFTIDTLNMTTAAYAFYVRTPSSPIKNLKTSAKLKVEVYLPEDDSDDMAWRHFARPVKTYYLSQSIPSEDVTAQYWHVFNIKKIPSGETAVLGNSIGDVNMIQSLIKMQYIK